MEILGLSYDNDSLFVLAVIGVIAIMAIHHTFRSSRRRRH